MASYSPSEAMRCIDTLCCSLEEWYQGVCVAWVFSCHTHGDNPSNLHPGVPAKGQEDVLNTVK